MRTEDGKRRGALPNGLTNGAVLYARVSSKEQEQGYSIPAQKDLLRRYAARHGLTITQEFVDIERAKSAGRPGFAAMVKLLQQRPDCRAVLVEKTDRLYRNLKDYITMDELNVEIHMVKENEKLHQLRTLGLGPGRLLLIDAGAFGTLERIHLEMGLLGIGRDTGVANLHGAETGNMSLLCTIYFAP